MIINANLSQFITSSIENTIVKIRRSYDRLISTMSSLSISGCHEITPYIMTLRGGGYVYYWCVKIPQSGYMEDGLKLRFMLKNKASLAMCYNPPLVRDKPLGRPHLWNWSIARKYNRLGVRSHTRWVHSLWYSPAWLTFGHAPVSWSLSGPSVSGHLQIIRWSHSVQIWWTNSLCSPPHAPAWLTVGHALI